MKLRLEVDELTKDDAYIWGVRVRRSWTRTQWCAMYDAAQRADRRDADVMLALEQIMPGLKFGEVWGRAHRRMTMGIGILYEDPWSTLVPIA